MTAPVFPPPARSIRTPRRVNIGRAVTIDYTYALQPSGRAGSITIGEVTGLQAALDAIGIRLDAIEIRLDAIDETLDDLQDQIDAITGTTSYLELAGGGRITLLSGTGFLLVD